MRVTDWVMTLGLEVVEDPNKFRSMEYQYWGVGKMAFEEGVYEDEGGTNMVLKVKAIGMAQDMDPGL